MFNNVIVAHLKNGNDIHDDGCIFNFCKRPLPCVFDRLEDMEFSRFQNSHKSHLCDMNGPDVKGFLSSPIEEFDKYERKQALKRSKSKLNNLYIYGNPKPTPKDIIKLTTYQFLDNDFISATQIVAFLIT
jgi:hypothetical protein